MYGEEINIKVMQAYTQYALAPEKLLDSLVNFFTPQLQH